jgi:hypothetical protein
VTINEERLRTIMHDTSGRSYAVGEDLSEPRRWAICRMRPAARFRSW